jgi:hypothetical protein
MDSPTGKRCQDEQSIVKLENYSFPLSDSICVSALRCTGRGDVGVELWTVTVHVRQANFFCLDNSQSESTYASNPDIF